MRGTRWGVLALALAGGLAAGAMTLAARAEEQPFSGGPGRGLSGAWSALGRPTPEDRAAFADARIAALHVGLKLNPDQEKLWPPVESAIRDYGALARAQREARRARDPNQMREDAPGALRAMADAQAARAEALRKLADATQPLYATLDAGQKRRALILARPMGGGPGAGPGRHRGPDRGRGGDE